MGLHRLLLSSDGENSSRCDSAANCGVPSPPKTSSRHLNNLFIASGCFVAVAFFVALTYYAVNGHLWRRRRRSLAEPSADDLGAVDETERDGHHVWFVSGAGLDAATIESIAAFEYKAGDGLLAGASADCSVCLAEFRDGELLRLLPKCGHAFHLPCIDTWLHGHVSCPLCRANIAAKPAAEEESVASAVLGVSGLEAARVPAEVEAEDSTAEVEIGQPKSSSCPPSRVPSDIGGGGGGSPSVRRWVSMISVHHGADLPTVEQGNSSKEATIQKDRPESEKSMILLLKKNGRTRSSILPL